MKNCKRCRLSKTCNTIPGICLWVPYALIAVVSLGLIALFVSQELF